MRLFLLVFSIFGLVIGCKVNVGSNESDTFKVSRLDLSNLNFEALKQNILIPKCLSCHRWVIDESLFARKIKYGSPDESDLFQRIESRQMPPKNGGLTSLEINYVRFFIQSYKGPTIPIKIPALEAKYSSLKYHLIDRSCLMCHDGTKRKPSLASYDQVRDHADDIVDYIEHGDVLGSPMPPLDDQGRPKAPVPSAEMLTLFKQWIQEGSLNN